MLYIQDPSYENSMYLHETLLLECAGCVRGAGARVLSPKRASKADASKQKQAEDQPPEVIPDEEADIDASYWTVAPDSEVLIAEIPNNNNRWSQANFSRQVFEEFFGATCGENGMYRILLKHVGADGTMGKTEVRPGVSVASRNYRFELDAAKGLPYPKGPERPIGIFVKVSPRDFVYTLLMPKPGVYQKVMDLLAKTQAPSPWRMRRIRYAAKDVRAAVSDLPVWTRMEKEEER